MRRSFLRRFVPALLLVGTFVFASAFGDDTKSLSDKAASIDSVEMVARFTDDSSLRLQLQDEKIELKTPYGTLKIPVKDIKKIEVRTRIPEKIASEARQAIAELGSSKHAVREAATARLIEMREKAYPALMEARHHSDPEIVQRANQIIAQLRKRLPKELLKYRTWDVIYTEDSKFSGEIVSGKVKVGTIQFGEHDLSLAHVHSFLLPGFKKPTPTNVLPDPGSLTKYRGQVGQVLHFRVTGKNNGSVWGTDVYTTDSSLGCVAVHAGVLRMGETGVVAVTIVTPPANFVGSRRNGVTTGNWGPYPSAYTVARVE